jgi:proteasome accessory factor B
MVEMNVSRIYRILRLITLLQSGRSFTPDELAAELEISRRTVFRDLNMLEMARIPYYFDPDCGGYRISEHFFLPPVNLTLTEALAMLVLAGRVRGQEHLPLLSHGSRAALKLQSVLPEPIRSQVSEVIDRVSFSLGPVSDHQGMDGTFDQLTAAVAGRKVCRIEYDSFQDRRLLDLEVRPLRLIFQTRAWYLLAYSTLHGEVRTFKMMRIRKLLVTGKTFDRPKESPGEDLFGQAWSMIPEGTIYQVHLRFAPKVAGNVAEVQWHRSQQVQRHADGSADFHVQVDGLGEITWWILGYGDQVEVISPPALRERVAAVAKAMLEKYSGGGGL